MFRVGVVIAVLALLVHAVRYRLVLVRTRAAEGARLPVGDDGIVPGAASFTLDGSPTHAVLLVHGFGDTTQSVRLLAEHLCGVHGWTVRAVLLPGHGRTLADFDAAGSREWCAAVHDEYVALRSRFSVVTLVGLSMGGALATIEAASHPDLPALVLLVPYLTPSASAERLAPVASLARLLAPYLAGGDRERSIFDPAARGRTLGAGAAPVLRIRDLVRVAHDARHAASRVTAPVRLVHSMTDYRIATAIAERHPGYFTGAAACELWWVSGGGHVVTVDFCHDEVFALTADWLAQHAGAPSPPGVTGS